MNAVCYKCGEAKVHPLQRCARCQASPQGEEDLAQSFLLSKSFLPEPRLTELAGQLASGRHVEMAPEVKTLVLAQIGPVLEALARAPVGPPADPAGNPAAASVSLVQYLLVAGALVVVAGVIAVVVLLQSPWFSYRQAVARDTVEAYAAFIDQHPGSAYAALANTRREELNDDLQWRKICDENTVAAYDSYLKYYPDGKYAAEAEQRLGDIDRMAWLAVAESRDIAKLKKFIKDHPDSGCLAEAWARIEWLINDWDWVRAQDNVERYEYFLKQNPDHPQAEAARQRLAELTAKAVKAGKPGKLPRLNVIAGSSGTGKAKLTIANRADASLSVVVSKKGSSQKVTVAAGSERTLELATGLYSVTAQADGPPAKSYYGELVFVSAVYELVF
ncbi:hypothetical protein JW859_08745 [bacterium]|nr:hypothetical protein [bacterium]